MQFQSSDSVTGDARRAKRLIRWMSLSAAGLLFSLSSTVQAQPYINVSVGGAIAPGVYGQIAIGNNPPPPVVNPQPVTIGPAVYGAAPVYFYVPVAHQRDWARYCGNYHACGRPVHFVQLEERNRWWEHHNEHLRGEQYYRRPEPRREEHEHEERRERR